MDKVGGGPLAPWHIEKQLPDLQGYPPQGQVLGANAHLSQEGAHRSIHRSRICGNRSSSLVPTCRVAGGLCDCVHGGKPRAIPPIQRDLVRRW